MANNQQLLLGEGAGGGIPNYIEEVFSTYLYTGNFSTQTITNNIDLSGEGGLLWIKNRTSAGSNILFDTARGADNLLQTNQTDAQFNSVGYMSTFNSNGFGLVSNYPTNTNGNSYVSWTFRKQKKFFDVVTYTGNGTSSQTINHNLGASPGCIITKRTDSTGNWTTWHRSFADTKTYIYLNTTAASVNVPSADAMTVSSTSFTVGSNQVFGNGSGFVYVAYLFAHDAGGFGLAGTDNVISCGSFTTDGSALGQTVNLGYEPQWVLTKESADVRDWYINDTMRGLPVGGQGSYLEPNTSDAETIGNPTLNLTSTGFYQTGNGANATYIYIAIRRGPMKVPTVGTSVFSPVLQTNVGAQPFAVTAGFPVDSALYGQVAGWGVNFIFSDRLRGATNLLLTTSTNSEATNNSTYGPSISRLDSNTQFKDGMTNTVSVIYWMMRRAPGFFDEVCYTGTGSVGNAITHNLTVAPELAIFKGRAGTVGASNWSVFTQFASTNYVRAFLQLTDVGTTFLYTNNAGIASVPTATTITVDNVSNLNNGSTTYVAYLFATCAGVSKVGTYTGNGSSQTIACGFAAGSRFVMIKRTDSTGDWYVWDSARGIVAGNDPHLSLNTTAAEVTTDDSVDTDNSGFIVNQDAATNVNVTSATYIFLAIA